MFCPPAYFSPRTLSGSFCQRRTSRLYWTMQQIWLDKWGLFLVYLEHLISRTRCSLDHKILLLDNHKSHISLRVIDKAKSSGIVMLTIPPKISHRLQPLDVSVFGPFKRSYNKAMDNWMRTYPGQLDYSHNLRSSCFGKRSPALRIGAKKYFIWI